MIVLNLLYLVLSTFINIAPVVIIFQSPIMSSSPLRFGDLNRYAQAELPLLILLIHRIQRTLAFASESSEQALSIEEFYTKYRELASDAVESLVSLLFSCSVYHIFISFLDSIVCLLYLLQSYSIIRR